MPLATCSGTATASGYPAPQAVSCFPAPQEVSCVPAPQAVGCFLELLNDSGIAWCAAEAGEEDFVEESDTNTFWANDKEEANICVARRFVRPERKKGSETTKRNRERNEEQERPEKERHEQ